MTADGFSWDSAVVGRATEQAALGDLLATVADRSATVVVHGDVGTGKSTLLRWLADEAAEQKTTVVEATGVEFERELAFGGLTAVLRPLLVQLDDLGPAQRSALEVAMGVEPGEASALTTYGAILSLLSLAAEERPVLVLVDDAQWVDRASLASLLFAAQRAGVDRVGFVFAQRVGVRCLLDDTGFDRLELAGIGRAAATDLLGPFGVVPAVADRCWELAGGNPLALIEGARGLTPRQRIGHDPVPPALPVTDRLLEAFRARLDELPTGTVEALAVAALETDGDPAVVAAALVACGRSAADLDPAERHGLLTLDGGRWRWHHPLLRSAVHQGADGPWRRQVHRALADVLRRSGRERAGPVAHDRDDRRPRRRSRRQPHLAGHRGAAAGSDGLGGRRTRGRGPALDRRRRGRRASPGRRRRPVGRGRPRRPGRAARAPGRRGGVVATRTRMILLMSQARMWVDGLVPAIDRLEVQAAAYAEEDRASAAYLLLQVCVGRMSTLDAHRSVETAERAVALAAGSGDPVIEVGTAIAHTLCRVFAGGGPEWAGKLLPLARMLTEAARADVDMVPLAQVCGYVLMTCEHWDEADEIFRLAAASGDATGMIARSALARRFTADVLWRTGRWTESLVEASQALTLQETIRTGHILPGTLALLARIEAGLGHEESCRSHAAAALSTGPAADVHDVIAHSAIGLLELGAGRCAEAAAALDEVAARALHMPEPGWLWWQGDAVDAYVGCGRGRDARRLLDSLGSLAATTGRRWARAVVARGHGLLAGHRVADGHFGAALDGFRAVGAPFEEARTLLARGRRRLESGEPHSTQAGRDDVVAARAIFDRLGARTWSDRASAATGSARTGGDALTALLTPAELRVALAVGHGATNRDAAEQLFISAKTVDHHLRSIYRKLGLRSRAQLIALLAHGNMG